MTKGIFESEEDQSVMYTHDPKIEDQQQIAIKACFSNKQTYWLKSPHV
jgi:hypothetical protein